MLSPSDTSTWISAHAHLMVLLYLELPTPRICQFEFPAPGHGVNLKFRQGNIFRQLITDGDTIKVIDIFFKTVSKQLVLPPIGINNSGYYIPSIMQMY